MTTMTARDEGLVHVAIGSVSLDGNLLIPPAAKGIVLFAHGSGSSRFSTRNRSVASFLREGALGTLLIDLLTRQEEQIDERTGHLRFDIGLLADRLVGALEWLGQNPETKHLPVGLFGASTGGAGPILPVTPFRSSRRPRCSLSAGTTARSSA